MVALGLLFWSVLVGYSVDWNIDNLYEERNNLALQEARANWNKDQAIHHWANRHGGAYVPLTEHTPPNPFLAHLKDREIVTSGGKLLTLMNPAYMLRQITTEYEDRYGIKGKITGRKTLNPVNIADPWELAALDRFERESINEVYEQATIDSRPYMRYMKPVYMVEGCVKCHGILGFENGDLRGGVSVSIPMTNHINAAKEAVRFMIITHATVWGCGVLGMVGFGFYASHRQTEQRQLLAKLEHGALYDSLTGLPNRFLFSDRLRVAIAKQHRDKKHKYAVCFVDLDRFKNLNDSYGHNIGDILLQMVSDRFSKILRPADTVARMGGDEFTFLLDDLVHQNEALLIADRILESVNEPFEINGHALTIGASIGICHGLSTYQYPDEILRDADIAMYRAKYLGKGRVDIFEPEMHAKVARTTRIEHDLHGVFERDEMELHYQPIISLKTGMIAGFEALLRWHHPELGNIRPDEFIPIAESSEQIQHIGRWVMSSACRELAVWNEEFGGKKQFFVSVNLSGRQVSQLDIVGVISNILAETGVNPGNLHCEVTETLLIADQDIARSNMAKLGKMGIQLSADDFGTGYSSLTYLQNFSFNSIKIDKQFVQGLEPTGKGRRLVVSLLKLALDFDLSVIAEGVETKDQLYQLQALDCQMAQGYYICQPLPVVEVGNLLSAGAHLELATLLQLNPFSKRGA
jgi:diguanylate cyclase (GGDEF)-like protein